MRFAVIPTIRRDCLVDCLDTIGPQVDRVIVIDNSLQRGPELWDMLGKHGKWTYLTDDEKPPNLSRFWNRGLEQAEGYARRGFAETWEVAVLNDDAIVPAGWFDKVASVMRERGAAAGCSGGTGPFEHLHTQPGPVSLFTRMTGWAFILAGEKGLRADENLRWWAGDDDLDWQARQAGGMVMVPGLHVANLYPNGCMTPELQVQAGKDMETLLKKWGQRPW